MNASQNGGLPATHLLSEHPELKKLETSGSYKDFTRWGHMLCAERKPAGIIPRLSEQQREQDETAPPLARTAAEAMLRSRGYAFGVPGSPGPSMAGRHRILGMMIAAVILIPAVILLLLLFLSR